MDINFINKTRKSVKEYKDIINEVFSKMEDDRFFNVIFVTKNMIHKINKEYRGIDRVTDVITFALQENTDEIFNDAVLELGDVFICVDRAIEQANEYKHSIRREIAFLAVHGYLHLLGYDHMTKEDEQVMFSLQDKILNDANIRRE